MNAKQIINSKQRLENQQLETINQKIKIGIDARMFATGFTGIGRYVFELIQNLAKLDTKNEFVCFLNAPEFKNFQAPAPNFRAVKVDAPHYSIAEQTKFLHALNTEKLDLMHFTHFNAPFFYRGKSIVTIHDLTLSFFPGKKMNKFWQRVAYNLVLRRTCTQARKIIAVSQNTKNDLQKILKISTEKIQVILNGVGKEFRPAKNLTALRQYLSQKFGIHQDFLLYTGVWRNHKNLLGLLKALAKLLAEKSFSGSLVITGRADPIYAPEIFALIKKLNLAKNVIFPGLVPDSDLLALLQSARVFVFPSFYEGFGLPLLEAMGCGIPIVASSASSIPEVCGEAAVFFDPYNITEMAKKIEQVWEDEKLRAELVARGFEQVKQFSWERCAREIYSNYEF
jgi:glycosyltransferase involved in cell wall biosynthesis